MVKLAVRINFTQQQTFFTTGQKGNVTTVTASHELSRMIATNGKSYTEGDYVKQCLVKTTEIVCPEKAHLFKDISLTRNTVAEFYAISSDLNQQLKGKSLRCEHFLLQLMRLSISLG